LLEQGVETLQKKEAALTNRLLEGISQISGITVFGPPPGKLRTGVVSLDGSDNLKICYLINEACDKQKKPWIYAGALV
jgi:selenocysteine lyase/cysteine desulfurase